MKITVNAKQTEVLCTFFEENPEVIKGYKKTNSGIEAVQTKWRRITPQLNSLGEEKDHRSWAKYLCNIKAKMKRKTIKWRQNGTGSIISNTQDFSELELRMLQILQKNKEELTQDNNNSDVEIDTNVKDDESGSDAVESSWHDTMDTLGKSDQNETRIKLQNESPELQLQTHNFSVQNGEDEFDTFGKNISQQLRTLPLAEALETQEMLLSVLRRQRLKFLNSIDRIVPEKINRI